MIHAYAYFNKKTNKPVKQYNGKRYILFTKKPNEASIKSWCASNLVNRDDIVVGRVKVMF
jgi:hypothetical protein